MTGYRITIENFGAAYVDVQPLLVRHYGEMQARLEGQGMRCPPFNPRLGTYVASSDSGDILLFVVRSEKGEAVGYALIWLALDMHNSELISQEDAIYVRPDHRNGIGMKLTKHILNELRSRGVKRAHVTTMTDLRVAKLCERVGFRHTAHAMTLFFEDI